MDEGESAGAFAGKVVAQIVAGWLAWSISCCMYKYNRCYPGHAYIAHRLYTQMTKEGAGEQAGTGRRGH